MINEEEEDDEFLINNTQFKPPDRSTSAPPSLSRLNSNSLFSFRANDLFNDIRADEQYYEFYISYVNQDKLPPPLEIQQSFYNIPENEFDFSQTSRNQFFQEYFKQGPALNYPPQHQQFFQQQPQSQQQSPYGYPPQSQQQQQSQQSQQYQQPKPQQPPYGLQRQPSFGSTAPIGSTIGYPTMNQQIQQQQQLQQQIQQQQQQLQQLQQRQHQLQQQQAQHSQQAQQQQRYIQQQQQQQQQQQSQQSQQSQQQQSQNDLWNVQRGLSQLQMNSNDNNVNGANKDDYMVKSSFDVAFSTVNQLMFDSEPPKYGNGGGLPRSASNSSLTQIFEPQVPRVANSSAGGNSGKPPIGITNSNATAGGSTNIVRPVAKVNIGSNLLHSDLSQYSIGQAPQQNNMLNTSGSSIVAPINRTPTPPSQVQPPQQSSSSSVSPSASQSCRYFTQGYCSKGSKCSFVHDQTESSTSSLDKLEAVAAVVNSNNSSNNNNNNEKQNNSGSSVSPVTNTANTNGNQNIGNSNSGSVAQQTQNNKVSSNKPPQQTSSSSSSSSSTPSTTSNQNNRKSLPEPSNILSLKPTTTNPNQRGRQPTLPPHIRQQQQQQMQQLSISSPPITDPITSDISKKIDLIANKAYTSVEQLVGSIYPLCRDQHGCRFLQKKLEESDPQLTEIIFKEVCDYMLELMTDPFGNYLCQKLLEHCNDQQRLTIIEKVGTDIVRISMNMHGTRAVQKMIEYLTTPEQIELIKRSLKDSVVQLIQDLNGNHVIQKCLNKLSPQDNQFIYDSVSSDGNCVAVATHRHGCCVLQRCIDHASESQKLQLIQEVIANSLVLVQDPYGNYVVQYVLDLPFQGLATEMAKRFVGNVPILATQKFSSNVVEKCLHVADATTRGNLIQEVIDYDNLLYLLQDPYANYVIQTSLTISEPHQHTKLVEAIRPHLPLLKNTPYGKRIQNKIIKEARESYNFN